jgi:hypothetical protein
VVRKQRENLSQLGADIADRCTERIGPPGGLVQLRARFQARLGRGSRPGLHSTLIYPQRVAGPRERVSLSVNEALDFECKFDLAAPIEALAGSTLVGLELGKLSFPETKDVWFDSTDAGYIPDLEIQAIRDVGRVDNALAGKL